jgi:transposase
MTIISLKIGLGADPENQFSFFIPPLCPDLNGYTTGFIKYKN